MIEVFEKIIIPIATLILGFIGGCTLTIKRYKRSQKSISIVGDNNEVMNGDKK